MSAAASAPPGTADKSDVDITAIVIKHDAGGSEIMWDVQTILQKLAATV